MEEIIVRDSTIHVNIDKETVEELVKAIVEEGSTIKETNRLLEEILKVLKK